MAKKKYDNPMFSKIGGFKKRIRCIRCRKLKEIDNLNRFICDDCKCEKNTDEPSDIDVYITI